MTILSRRRMLSTSGIAACASLGGFFATFPALAQKSSMSSNVQTTAPTSVKYSHCLEAWVTREATKAAGNITSGKGTPRDWRKLEKSFRAYAKHLEDTGINRASSYLANLASKSGNDFSHHPAVDTLHEKLVAHGSSVSRGQLATRMQYSSETMQKASASIRDHGYSYQYHQMADYARGVAGTLTYQTYKQNGFTLNGFLPAVLRRPKQTGRVVSAVYTPGYNARLQKIDSHLCSFMKSVIKLLGISDQLRSEICDYLADASYVSGAATVALATEIVCDGAIVGSIIATDGATITIAGPLESLVCDALSWQAGATFTGIMVAVQCAMGC